MAKQKSGGVSDGMGIIVFAATSLAMAITWPLRAMSRSEALGNWWRQGLHELGNTFGQMLPDSNTAHGSENIWSPKQSDMATDRKPYKHFYGSQHAVYTPGMGGPASPSEVAKNNRTYRPPDQSNEQGPELEP
jgi:hypothetical protein